MTLESGTPLGSDSAAGESAPGAGPAPATEPARPRTDRSWLAPLATIAALFVVLTIATTAAVVVAGPSKQSPAAGLSTGPGAAVQSWAAAMEAGDFATADTYLSSNVKSRGMTSQFMLLGQDLVSLSVGSVSINGTSATVEINFTTSSESDTTNFATVPMVQEGGGWKIDDTILQSLY
jgi:hypothetical protein